MILLQVFYYNNITDVTSTAELQFRKDIEALHQESRHLERTAQQVTPMSPPYSYAMRACVPTVFAMIQLKFMSIIRGREGEKVNVCMYVCLPQVVLKHRRAHRAGMFKTSSTATGPGAHHDHPRLNSQIKELKGIVTNDLADKMEDLQSQIQALSLDTGLH